MPVKHTENIPIINNSTIHAQHNQNTIIKKKLVVVLGMHRSGTSLLSRSLKIFGMHDDEEKSKLHNAFTWNKKGLWENRTIMHLNEKILLHIGHTWHSPLAITEEEYCKLYKSTFFNEAINIIEECFHNRTIYALKEPRITKLLPFWKKVFSTCNLEVKYLFIFRNPSNVAASLMKRDTLMYTKSIFLWYVYNLFALQELSCNAVLLIEYEDFLENVLEYIDLLEVFIEEKRNNTEEKLYVENFLDKSLCHHKGENSFIQQIMYCYDLYFEMKKHQKKDTIPFSLHTYLDFYEKNKHFFYIFMYQDTQQLSDTEAHIIKESIVRITDHTLLWEDAYIQTIILCEKLGMHSNAVVYACKLMEIQPNNCELIKHLATCLREKKDFRAMTKLMTHAMQKNPLWGEPHIQFALMYAAQNNVNKAIACARKALQVEPKNITYTKQLCDYFYKENNIVGLRECTLLLKDII